MPLSPSHLVAHRGHQACFPENSLLAIIDAIAAGALQIEFDIQFTADGVPVLYHDQSMLRLSGQDAQITDLPCSQLGEYALFEPERFGLRFYRNPITPFSTLLPLLHQCPQVRFYLELKEESLEQQGVANCLHQLAQYLPRVPDNLVLISFNAEAVRHARAFGFAQTGLVLRDWSARNALLTQAQATVGFCNHHRIPIEQPITACCPILVYETDTPHRAAQLLQRGAAAVETFCIRALLEAI